MARCKECLHFGICKKGFPFADGKGGGWCEDFLTADVAPKSEWISVKDDTPKNGMARVLVSLMDDDFTKPIGFNKIDTDRFIDGKWARWGRHVTHWMPLPEPPKGEFQ